MEPEYTWWTPARWEHEAQLETEADNELDWQSRLDEAEAEMEVAA